MLKVLVIEDNPEIRENTAEFLEISGYEPITAVNGKTGFEKAKKNVPDVIICDIMMPASDGIEFFKLIKGEITTKNIPLIFFSAGSAPVEVRKGLVKGADFYLSKPFTDFELIDAIQMALQNKSQKIN